MTSRVRVINSSRDLWHPGREVGFAGEFLALHGPNGRQVRGNFRRDSLAARKTKFLLRPVPQMYDRDD